MNLSRLKHWLLPRGSRPMTVWRGPFRGARMHAEPADSLRKVLGLYEHELNDWLARVLPRVDTVLDVGANDGYFTFGCAAAFRRMGKRATIVAYEPEELCCQQLADGLRLQDCAGVDIRVERAFVGKEITLGQTTLDALPSNVEPRSALIKIDVEGAELDVIEGASRWLNDSNYFLIELHHEHLLEKIRGHFAWHQGSLELRNQQSLPLLGRESRPPANCWLVTPAS